MEVDAPGRVRVLLVDDAPEARRLVRTALRFSGGFEIVGEAATGVAAITLVDELEPDLVVLDLGLPDITGRAVLSQVREQRPGIKVVIFSGTEPEDRAWWDANAQGYVLKDSDLDYLVTLLESVSRPEAHTDAVLDLPQDLSSVRAARRFVRKILTEWGLQPLMDDAQLVVSELAANAITHASLRLPGAALLVLAHAADRGARRWQGNAGTAAAEHDQRARPGVADGGVDRRVVGDRAHRRPPQAGVGRAHSSLSGLGSSS